MRLTPPEQRSRSSNFPQSSASLFRWGGAIACLALAVFTLGIFDDSFIDEYAYITQSYYSDLFFSGNVNNPEWLGTFAFDLQPLPKYFIGVGLRAVRLRMPAWIDAARWYGEPRTQFGPPATLTVARVPFIVAGAVGCVALFAFGVLVGGRRAGTIAALLLTINPLFRLHAHRAMSEAPCEAFLIAALWLGLLAWKGAWSGRRTWVSLIGFAMAGVCSGLSILCKFNGLLAPMIIVAWCAVSLLVPSLLVRRKLAMAAGAALTISLAIVTFVTLNPALTARPSGRFNPEFAERASQGPWTRFVEMVKVRLETSAGQQRIPRFVRYALTSPVDKAAVFAAQGFGRFGPFGPAKSDSDVRYQLAQDWGLVLWWPMVIIGVLETLRLGRNQLAAGEAPTALALLIWAGVSWVVVAAYIPMAWDRYLLPIQAPNSVLVAVAVSRFWDRWREKAVELVTRKSSLAAGVFLILLGSYAFFWHSRDWNTASRLMLTYAMVDRGRVEITGLDRNTGDKAFFRGRYYSDKLPGYPLLAALPYVCAKWAFRLPSHPLGGEAEKYKYWPADYWITLGTSGLLTAWTAALLVLLARDLGCGAGAAALVGLAYGLSTPAYVYATLAYGHQASAFALLASFLLIRGTSPRFAGLRLALAGFLAALASVIELQVAPVSAILGLYLLTEVLRGRHRPGGLGLFALGAVVPTLAMLVYHDVAFGSPWEMGYFHHVNFAHVHTRRNPLGLRSPDWGKLGPLLWSRYRGLFFHAPILILALPGWVVLMLRRLWSLVIVSLLICASVLLVNLSYPEWTGGWSTGPRLLLPLIPFAMIPVAGLLAAGGRWTRPVTWIAVALAFMGGVEMLLFQGASARIPNETVVAGRGVVWLSEPLVEAVWPIWTGRDPSPGWRFGERFCHNLVSYGAPRFVQKLGPRWEALQFLPLVVAQVLAIWLLWRHAMANDADEGIRQRLGRSDLRIDEQQDRGRQDQDERDPQAQADRVPQDPPPGFVAGGRIDQADRDDQRQDQPVDLHG
jgi:4-amino-4-deoxy-L-arabinose transferase-like glycosyltransferase